MKEGWSINEKQVSAEFMLRRANVLKGGGMLLITTHKLPFINQLKAHQVWEKQQMASLIVPSFKTC